MRTGGGSEKNCRDVCGETEKLKLEEHSRMSVMMMKN
jgi:hypothetical protein